MKEIYELDVYKLADELSDLIWYAFDEWPGKVKQTSSKFQISSLLLLKRHYSKRIER